MSLYLTYDIYPDGFGAQYQRVIGIYCLAKYYNIKYLHTPIQSIAHLPTDYWKKINDHFGLSIFEAGKNGIPENFEETLTINTPSIEDLQIKTNKDTVMKITLPYHILDNDPEIYDRSMDELRQLKQKLPLPEYSKDTTNIAIHMRRGDVSKDVNSDRYTDNAYYVKLIDILKQKYDHCNIFIFTQGSEDLDEFKEMENVKIMNDLDILETFEYLCNADVFIMAKSSLSYLAALYNNNDVYIQPFWHSKLARWKNIDELMEKEGKESFSTISSDNSYFFFIIVGCLLLFFFIYKFNFFKKIFIQNIKKVQQFFRNIKGK